VVIIVGATGSGAYSDDSDSDSAGGKRFAVA
jgi:hypothetical protein